MVIGIGTDIVEHFSNAKLLDWIETGSFPDRLLSEAEISLYMQADRKRFIAGRFAAKEAVLKSLGIGMQDGISLKDISITTLPTGQPIVELSGPVKHFADQLGINKWHITITHSPLISIAFVISEKI